MSRRRKAVIAAALVVVMAGFGAGVNRFLASRTTVTHDAPANPTQAHPELILPGTIYLAASGGLYALHGSGISALQKAGQGWTQPVLLPGGGGLLAVKVTANYYSDLYELNLHGGIRSQLSHDSGKVTATQLGNDDWIFYPAIGPDGTLYFSYDYPKAGVCEAGNGYQVDYSIWSTKQGSVDINRTAVQDQRGITQQSWANYYTGGDVSPVPLLGGGMLYVDYESAYGAASQMSTALPGASQGTEISQIRLDPKIGAGRCPSVDDGTPLTQPQDDCAQPALNQAQNEIAMICTPVTGGSPSSTEADLVVASFDAQTGTLGPLQRLVTGTLAAQPAWSPDGQSLLYLAPEAGNGYFELWYLKGALSAHRSAPEQITTGLDIDSQGAPAWSAS